MKWHHGTRAKFDRFTKPGSGKHGLGFYFTNDPKEARAFAHILAGDGSSGTPRVLTVNLRTARQFDTMSIEDCQSVAAHFGIEYRIPRHAGGPKEHYHHLVNQLIRAQLINKAAANEAIQRAGFDSIFCEFFGHLIVLSEDQIEILESQDLE